MIQQVNAVEILSKNNSLFSFSNQRQCVPSACKRFSTNIASDVEHASRLTNRIFSPKNDRGREPTVVRLTRAFCTLDVTRTIEYTSIVSRKNEHIYLYISIPSMVTMVSTKTGYGIERRRSRHEERRREKWTPINSRCRSRRIIIPLVC